MPQVSILVPVFNEAASVETILRKVAASPFEKEVLVVDDGSTDGTAAILERLERELPIQVVTHPVNLGKGQAVRSALAHATGTFCLIQDADLE